MALKTPSVRIRLTRKFANLLDGIDVSARRAGETIELPAKDAWLLLAEGWAEPAGGGLRRVTLLASPGGVSPYCTRPLLSTHL